MIEIFVERRDPGYYAEIVARDTELRFDTRVATAEVLEFRLPTHWHVGTKIAVDGDPVAWVKAVHAASEDEVHRLGEWVACPTRPQFESYYVQRKMKSGTALGRARDEDYEK